MNKKASTKDWPMSEARTQLSRVLNQAISRGPQTITRRGQATVMVLSMPDSSVALGAFLRARTSRYSAFIALGH